MKAQELRIGNYLQGKSIVEVIEIRTDGVMIRGNSSSFRIDEPDNCLEPIPLTEEWLTKFGLNPKHTDQYYPKEVYEDEDGFHYVIEREYNDYGSEYYIEVDVRYIHQLQNLYFCLCGEELQLKEITV